MQMNNFLSLFPTRRCCRPTIQMKNFLSLFPARPVRRLRDLPNVNSLWGALVVEELVRLGVSHFCVCPGSRSAPLAVAIAR